MADRMVKLTNMVNKIVGVTLPEFGVNRTWQKKGQSYALPFDTVRDMLWDEGFKNMIDRGMLYIDNMQDKIDLGLELEGTTEPENIIALTDDQIKKLLTTSSFEDFKETVDKISGTQVASIANYAILNEIVDSAKCDYLYQVIHIDVIKAIARNKEVERAEALEKAKK